MQPVRSIVKGRGAVSSPAGRFERDRRVAVDDGWGAADAPDIDDIHPLHPAHRRPESGESPPSGPATTVREEVARSIISRNRSPDIGFDASINPYRGCEHGCVYCYARPGHAYLGLSPGLDFETRLVAKVNAPELLQAALSRPGYCCETIAIGTVTDAWQPIERRLALTRGCIEVLARSRHPLSLITKSSLVERDIDLLAPMAREGLVCATVTLTTLDPALARSLEPRAPAPWRRLQTIRRLADAGIPVGVSLAPVIPFVNEPEIESILEAAHAAGAGHASYVVLRLPLELREVFHDWLHAHVPDRATRVIARLRDMRGGRDNDPRFGWRMKGTGPFADMIRMRVDTRLRRLGIGRERPTLRTDRFVPPDPPTPAVARRVVPIVPVRSPHGVAPVQGTLF